MTPTPTIHPPTPGIEEGEVLDLLTHLVDKSLVVYDERTGRYRLLETVRQFSHDRLREIGEGDRPQERHGAFFLAQAEEAEPMLHSAAQIRTLDALEAEHDNLRAALDWLLTGETHAEDGLRLAGALFWFWQLRAHISEGRERLDRALKRTEALGSSKARATALHGAGQLAFYGGDHAAAYTLLSQSAAMWQEIGDPEGRAYSLIYLGGLTARYANDFEAALALHQEGVALWRQTGNRWGLAMGLWMLGTSLLLYHKDAVSARPLLMESVALFRQVGDRWGLAGPLFYLARAEREQGRREAALALMLESLEIVREVGDMWRIAGWLYRLGLWAQEDGAFADARAYLQESLTLFRDMGNEGDISDALLAFAFLANAQGQRERAVRLHAATSAVRETLSLSLAPAEREKRERDLAELNAALGTEAFARADVGGRALTLEQAVAYALSEESE
jgi:tetratricopeptide (TPR) repeat protein